MDQERIENFDCARNGNDKRKENLKAAELFSQAMDTLREYAVGRVKESSPPLQQTRLLIDCVRYVVTGMKVPCVKILEESSLSKVYDVGLPDIPQPLYEKVVDWINHFDAGLLGGLVMWASDLLLDHLVAIQERREGKKACCSKDPVFVVLAVVLRSNAGALVAAFPHLRNLGQEKIHVKIIVWMIAQAFPDNTSAGLYSWAHILLPVLASDCKPEARDLNLKFVDGILSKPCAYPKLLRNRAKLLIPPSSFEMLVRLTFPATRVQGVTEKFEEIYPVLKEVALAGSKAEEIRQIFTSSLKLLGEGYSSNSVLANEATSIGLLCLGRSFINCCNHWDNLYKENLEASVALLENLFQKWKEYFLKLSSPGGKTEGEKYITGLVFRFSLKFAGEGYSVLANKAIPIAIWCLEESYVDCCDHWDNLYKENLEASVALLQKLVEKWKDGSLKLSSSREKVEAKKQFTRQMFTFSLKVAEGNSVLAKEAIPIAIWCLEESFVDCCHHWDNLYKDYLESSVALLQKVVEKWKDGSLKLSSSSEKAEAKKQFTRQMFRFSLKFTGEGYSVLANKAIPIAIWCLEESYVDCCDHWDNLYKENLEASVALLQKLVEKWKDGSLKLSSSREKAEAKKQFTRQMFTFSLKVAEGNSVLAKEAIPIAIWCLEESFVDCCHHWENLYKENPEASVALLQKVVEKWKDGSLKLSSLGRTGNARKAEKVTGLIFRFSLKLAGEGNPVLAREATSVAMLCLTESFVDCCNHWDKLYEENLEASVALLQKLVHEWKDHSLKLSSSSDTLDRTIKNFRLKNMEAITRGYNASLYTEADKSCKVILSRGSGKLLYPLLCFSPVALVLALIGFHNVAIWE